jgi:murein DD-endopeptidase MepM/ murein hydrolase activator NlpD
MSQSSTSVSNNKTIIPNLAAYQQKANTGIILTKPGYDIYFYSRADSTLNPYPSLEKETDFLTFSNITPTFHISSNDRVPIVTMMQVSAMINNSSGSSAQIEIVDPQGVEYFKPTIGDSTKAPPDYDHSYGETTHRISTMDTILIKLSNSTYLGGSKLTNSKETVFRGVISNIERSQSPKGGTIIRLSCLDFSEYLRQMIAMPIGFFTTISVSVTGRGLTNNLLKYANILLSGWKQFPGVTKDISSVVDFLTTGTVADGGVSVQTGSQNYVDTTHAMTCPPFFWLEYAQYKNTGKKDDIFGGAGNIIQNIQDLLNAFISTGQQFVNAASGQITTDSISQNIINTLSTLSQNTLFSLLTPEDKEAVTSYQAYVNDGVLTSKATKFDVTNSTKGVNNQYQLQHIAWILSDLYLEKGLLTFEEQQVWATMFGAAARSNREVYFDISPKLNPNPISMFDTASVQDLGINSSSSKYNPSNLDDIHPNIGIVKYRLSPCFLPYPKNGPSTTSEFRYFNITDNMIMETTQSENEQGVYTAVYGFPDAVTPQVIKDELNSIGLQQNKFFAYAQSIDPNIEKRLGYRFMTDHDNKIKIPIMMYLVSYVLLEKSQLSMFSQIVKITGNPIIQPGSIVRMSSQGIDYYCNEVAHQWTLGGYVTILNLEYGHQTGIAPAAITGYGVAEQFTQVANLACQMAAKQVGEFVSSSVNIGGVNEQCLISAMWEYMTCRANSSTLLKQCTRAYENAHPYVTPADWITLVQTFQNSTVAPYSSNVSSYFSVSQPQVTTTPISPTYTNIILNTIKSNGLDAYNVTLNTILNIIGHESSWVSNNQGAVNEDGTVDYGWFQINSTHFSEGIDALTACTNFAQACQFALGNVLLKAMQVNNPNKTGGVPFLNAITAYNQGQNGQFNYTAYPYAASVLGESQVQAIANGTQKPSGAKPGSVHTGLACVDPTADLTKWPYDVYGPIGMQLSALTSTGMTASQAKATLLNWQPGSSTTGAMQSSVKYIDKLLRKYQNTSFLPEPSYSTLINQSDLFSKVIAAWFNDEKATSSNNMAILTNATQQIKTIYQECIACTGLDPVTYSAADTSELQAVFNGIKFICPLQPSKSGQQPAISSGYRTPSRPTHQGIDIVYATGDCAGAPIVAPADGYVTGYTTGGKGGLAMSINHTDASGNINGAQSVFYDIGTYASGVTTGSFVKQTQVVAYLPTYPTQGATPQDNNGLTRQETGYHLHWEVHSGVQSKTTYLTGNTQTTDPAALLQRQGNPLTTLS